MNLFRLSMLGVVAILSTPIDAWACSIADVQSVRKTECALNGVYLGPHNAPKHGGHCVYLEGNCQMVAIPKRDSQNCGNDATYIGPNKPAEHGGQCVLLVNTDANLVTYRIGSIADRNECSSDGRHWVGANPKKHGADCITIQ